MSDEMGVFSRPTAERVIRGVERVEQTPGDESGERRAADFYPVPRVFKITGCAKATGYATAQLCRGNPDNPQPDTSTSVKVFLGKDGPYMKDDFIVAAPVAMTDIHWVAVCPLQSFFKLYAAPTSGELATTQDNPAASGHCTESVSIP